MSELAIGQLTEAAELDSIPRPRPGRRAIGWAVGLAALELITPHVLRPWGKTIIKALDEPGPLDSIAFAGLGRRDARSVAQDVTPLLPDQRLSYVKYANQGINPKSVGLALGAHYDAQGYVRGDNRGQTIIAHSLGHPTFLRGAEWRIKNGLHVPHVDRLIGISIPRDLADTSKQKEVDILLGAHYLGGTVSKMIIEGIQGYWARDEAGKRVNSLAACAWRGIKAGFTGCHPWHYVRQLRLLDQARSGYEDGVFEEVLTPRTEVTIFDSDLDKTVLRERATDSHREFFAQYGTTPTFITVPDMKHGDVGRAAAFYQERVALAA